MMSDIHLELRSARHALKLTEMLLDNIESKIAMLRQDDMTTEVSGVPADLKDLLEGLGFRMRTFTREDG